MTDDILIRTGDGVTREWTLSPANTGLTSVTVDGATASYAMPAWNRVLLDTAPAVGAQVSFSFKGTIAPKSGGGADGASRVYQYNHASSDYTLQMQEFFQGDGAQQTAVFELSGATVGDALTVVIESQPAPDYQVVFVIPSEFDTGTIRVVNSTEGNFWFATKNSLGSVFNLDLGRAPGVVSVLPGTTELVVMPHVTDAGFKVVQVNSLRNLVTPSYQLTERFATLAVGSTVEFILGAGFNGNRFLSYFFPYSVGFYSDQPCTLTLEVLSWNPSNRAFTNKVAEARWTPNAFGGVNFNEIEIIQDLPKMTAGNGTYSMLFVNTIARLKLTAFPSGTPPTRATATLTVSTMADYS